MILAFALLACAPEEAPPPEVVLLPPREQLIRLSVELRGVHPGPAELDAIEDDPTLYAEFADRYLEDPRFGGRVRAWFDERWRMKTGKVRFDVADAGVTASGAVVPDTLAEEPLRLVSHVVESDLPITEILTADYTVGDPLVAAVWGLDYPEGATGWQVLQYDDGRPAAGVLATTALWQRFQSKGGNANRSRANAVARLLLCDDFLSQPIVLDRADIDSFLLGAEETIATTEACQGCHVSLDPLAANLFGFFTEESENELLSERLYRPENETMWADYAGRAPGFYGRPTAGLHELAVQIAEDPRFVQCVTRTVVEGAMQRPLEDEDWTELQGYVDILNNENLNVKRLVRAVVLSDEFRAASFADPSRAARIPTVRTVSPDQLSGILRDLTGYTLTTDGQDALTSSAYGLGAMMGGVDGLFASRRNYEPTAASQILMRELSRAAAESVVLHDLDPARTAPAYLLGEVSADMRPETHPTEFEAQTRALYERVTGVTLAEDSAVPARLVQLWTDVDHFEGDTNVAWAAVVAAVLSDPRVIFY